MNSGCWSVVMGEKYRLYIPREILARYWESVIVPCMCVPWLDDSLLIMTTAQYGEMISRQPESELLRGPLAKSMTTLYPGRGIPKRIAIPMAFRDLFRARPGDVVYWIDGGNHVLLYDEKTFRRKIKEEIPLS